jgi:hypothetical protein
MNGAVTEPPDITIAAKDINIHNTRRICANFGIRVKRNREQVFQHWFSLKCFWFAMFNEIATSALALIVYILDKVRYIFYLVLPSECMYPELKLVPRYVEEVRLYNYFMPTIHYLLHNSIIYFLPYL